MAVYFPRLSQIRNGWFSGGVMAIAATVGLSLLPISASADIVIRRSSSSVESENYFVDDFDRNQGSLYDSRSEQRGYRTGSDRGDRRRYPNSINNSVLVNPVLVNPSIHDSLLINPVLIRPSQSEDYRRIDTVPRRSSGYRSGCLILSAQRAACQ